MAQGPIPVKVSNPTAIGNQFFVNESTGNNSNVGNSTFPFATLDAALAACTANHNDIIFLQGTVHRTSTLAWNKDGVSLVGLSAPSDNDRARISIIGSAVFTPLVNVTAQGCSFLNLGTFQGFADNSAQVCWAEAGGRNFYSNVQFLGGGNATAAAHVGMRSLTVDGAGENLFVGCTIGLDTVVRGVANASLEFINATPRNTFRQCTFQMDASASTPLHVTVGSGGLDRYAYFDDCAFLNAVESGATTIAAAIVANASAGGAVCLNTCFSLGATAIATTGPVYILGNVPVAATSSIAIKAT